MSIRAQLWVSELPLDCGLNLAAFRVLDKLADAHNKETNSAIRSADRIAGELGCSKRTVQRALKDLQILTFIKRGNQDLVAYLRADRRPVVWTLSFELWQPQPEAVELDGVTTGDTPSEAVDNSHGVTAVVAHGVTAVVTHTGRYTGRTERPSATTDRARACQHSWRPTNVGSFCIECGIRDDGKKRIDWSSMAVRPLPVRA